MVDGYADGETEIERTQPFTDIHLVEILEVDVTFPVPYIAHFRSSKDGKAVRPLLDEVVSVDDGDVYTVDGRCNGGFLQPGS